MVVFKNDNKDHPLFLVLGCQNLGDVQQLSNFNQFMAFTIQPENARPPEILLHVPFE